MKQFVFLILISIFSSVVNSQTLVMNEVSNGPSGNKEYIEFVVVDTTISYNCVGTTTPPCIDIRGWIVDDNDGYHGVSGVAAGAIRFSNNSIWSCMPVGTILLIYNDADVDLATMPAIDTSMVDGNCRIVVPASKSNWFDHNNTTPGNVSCSYPGSGWVPAAAGSWTNILLANVGDCARVVNLAGCEVFSVCWGSDNLNNLIYMGAGSATQRVYYFGNTVNNNATNNANWVNACASTTACGSNLQTPGAPNNAANAAWISSMNNSCTPIPPMSASLSSANGSCPCSASASVNVSGSLPPFSYTWTPVPGLGQGTSSVSGLCTGVYTCQVKSNTTKCVKTLTFSVSNGSVATTASNTGAYCAGNNIQLNTQPATSYSWSGPGGFTAAIQNPTIASSSPTMSGIYTVNVIVNGCSATATTAVTVNNNPTLSVNSATLCSTQSVILTASGAGNYTWNPGGLNGNSITISPGASQNYTVAGTNTAGCSGSAISNVSVIPTPTLIPVSATVCSGGTATLSVSGATGYTWNPGGLNGTTFTVSPPGNAVYTISGSSNNCTSIAFASVTIGSGLTITVNNPVICSGQSVQLNAGGAFSYTWSNGSVNPSISVSPTVTTTYSVLGVNGSCSASINSTVTVNPVPTLSVSGSASMCSGQSMILNASGAQNYSWSPGASVGNSITVSPLSNQVYTVTGSNAFSCSSSAFFSVSVIQQPTVSLSSSTICAGETATLLASGAGSYTLDPGTITVFPFTVSPSSSSAYTLTGANGACTGTAGALVAVVPSVSLSVSGASICTGQSALLTASGAINYTWTGGPNTFSFAVSPSSSSVFTVSGDNGVCGRTSTVPVIVYPIPQVEISSPGSCIGNPLQLNSAGASIYSWTGPANFSSSQQNISISNAVSSMSGSYTVTGTDLNGCSASRTLLVDIEKCACTVFIPEGFSPNADGAHDYFNITCIEDKMTSIEIFNRWGNLVYKSNNYRNDWNGKNNTGLLSIGDDLPAGTYYYIIKISDEDKARTGFVTLWR